jgi:hypothetical protein
MKENGMEEFWKESCRHTLIEKYDYMQQIGDWKEDDLCSFLFDIVHAVREEYGD